MLEAAERTTAENQHQQGSVLKRRTFPGFVGGQDNNDHEHEAV